MKIVGPIKMQVIRAKLDINSTECKSHGLDIDEKLQTCISTSTDADYIFDDVIKEKDSKGKWNQNSSFEF